MKDTVGKVGKAAKALGKRALYGVARTTARLVDKLPFQWSDNVAETLFRYAGKWGTSLAEDVLKRVPDADDLLALAGRLGYRNADEIGRLMETSVLGTEDVWRKGARFHLDQILHYGDDVDAIELRLIPEAGMRSPRVDLRLVDGTIVEVKDVSASTFGKNWRSYARQLDEYRDLTDADIVFKLKQWVDPEDIYKLLEGREDWLTVIPGGGT